MILQIYIGSGWGFSGNPGFTDCKYIKILYLCILRGAQDHQSFYLINMHLYEIGIVTYFFKENLKFEIG